jgi:uncharacterized protein DUF2585
MPSTEAATRRRSAQVLAHVVAVVLVLAAVAAILAAMGRAWWCRAGDGGLWAGDVWSRHNSQHFLDPYAFTHVLHGLVFYALVWAVFRRHAGAVGRAWIGFLLEAAWEVIENTDVVIGRYRAATISLDYYGDSVANSIGDILSYGVGYALAGVLPVWVSVATFVLVDGLLVLWIRDSLLLNVLMLVHPIEAVRQWQAHGVG